jgi:hypothetical protein
MTRLGYLREDGSEVLLSKEEARWLIERDPEVRRAWLKWHRMHPGGTVWLLYWPESTGLEDRGQTVSQLCPRMPDSKAEQPEATPRN